MTKLQINLSLNSANNSTTTLRNYLN